MNAANADNVRRCRAGRFADEMVVDEHQRRRDGPVVAVKFRLGRAELQVEDRDDGAAVNRGHGAAEPLRKRSGNGVVGHHGGHGGRVREVA